ncbi:hypothetical protein Q7P37_011086 [Cladosporium fusiforme]
MSSTQSPTPAEPDGGGSGGDKLRDTHQAATDAFSVASAFAVSDGGGGGNDELPGPHQAPHADLSFTSGDEPGPQMSTSSSRAVSPPHAEEVSPGSTTSPLSTIQAPSPQPVKLPATRRRAEVRAMTKDLGLKKHGSRIEDEADALMSEWLHFGKKGAPVMQNLINTSETLISLALFSIPKSFAQMANIVQEATKVLAEAREVRADAPEWLLHEHTPTEAELLINSKWAAVLNGISTMTPVEPMVQFVKDLDALISSLSTTREICNVVSKQNLRSD